MPSQPARRQTTEDLIASVNATIEHAFNPTAEERMRRVGVRASYTHGIAVGAVKALRARRALGLMEAPAFACRLAGVEPVTPAFVARAHAEARKARAARRAEASRIATVEKAVLFMQVAA